MRVELGKARCRFHGGLYTGPKTDLGYGLRASARDVDGERISSMRAFGGTRHATSKKLAVTRHTRSTVCANIRPTPGFQGRKGQGRRGLICHQRPACNGATTRQKFHDFGLKVPSMSVDLMLREKDLVTRVVRSAYWLTHDPTGMVKAGHGPVTK